MNKKYFRCFLLLATMFLLTACGFHLRGPVELAPQLHRMYIQTADPYSYLVRNLQKYLKVSNVQLASSPNEADTILVIIRDDTSEQLLSVNGTQRTRQYNLIATVVFEITTPQGVTVVPPQALAESRVITIQSNQILGSSNEATLFYQQMRRSLASAIIMRLASKEINIMVQTAFHPAPAPNPAQT